MCDPISLLAMATGLSGASAAVTKPPAAKLPATPVQDAKAETGAEVSLGGDRASDAAAAANKLAKTSTAKKTGGSGLKAGSKSTGLSIL
jgi:hypothetical protein